MRNVDPLLLSRVDASLAEWRTESRSRSTAFAIDSVEVLSDYVLERPEQRVLLVTGESHEEPHPLIAELVQRLIQLEVIRVTKRHHRIWGDWEKRMSASNASADIVRRQCAWWLRYGRSLRWNEQDNGLDSIAGGWGDFVVVERHEHGRLGLKHDLRLHDHLLPWKSEPSRPFAGLYIPIDVHPYEDVMKQRRAYALHQLRGNRWSRRAFRLGLDTSPQLPIAASSSHA